MTFVVDWALKICNFPQLAALISILRYLDLLVARVWKGKQRPPPSLTTPCIKLGTYTPVFGLSPVLCVTVWAAFDVQTKGSSAMHGPMVTVMSSCHLHGSRVVGWAMVITERSFPCQGGEIDCPLPSPRAVCPAPLSLMLFFLASSSSFLFFIFCFVL